MERRLVINADDFGLCEEVNKAVAKACTEGVLTSATIMANMPAAEQAVRIARELPDLGVGVHLNLTNGKPLSASLQLGPLLNSSGEFKVSPAVLAVPSLTPQVGKAIRAELAEQIRWVIDHGVKPTHVDSHKHIHTIPQIFSIVCQLARYFDIGAVRFAYEPGQVSAIPWPLPAEGQKSKARLIRTLARINRLQNRDFFKTNVMLGIAHMGKVDVSFFRAVALYNPVAVAEIMTHPGFDESDETEKSGLGSWRRIELEALCSEKTRYYLEQGQIKLVHYGQL